MSTVEINGLVMGGHPWRVTKTDMLNGVGVRTPSGERAGADGEWAGTSLRAARSGTIEGNYKGTSPVDLDAARARLQEAVALVDVPVTFHMPSGPQTVMARRAGEVLWEWVGGNVAKWSVLMKAHDPSLYLGDGVRPSWSGTTGRAYETGGVVFPLAFPLTWSSDVAGGQVEYRNPGTTGRVEFRLDGPLTNPVVTSRNSDGTRVLGWNITIPDGAWLYVDPERRRAMLNGQASRPPSQRGWPRLSPGSNQWLFNAAGGSAGSLTVFAWAAM